MQVYSKMEESLKKQIYQLQLLVAEQQTKLTHQLHWIQEQTAALQERERESAALSVEKQELQSRTKQLESQLEDRAEELGNLTKKLKSSEELVVKFRDGYRQRGEVVTELQQKVISLEGTIRQLQQQQQSQQKTSKLTLSRLTKHLSRSSSSPDVLSGSKKKHRLFHNSAEPLPEDEDGVATSPLSPLLELPSTTLDSVDIGVAAVTDDDASTTSDISQSSGFAANGGDPGHGAHGPLSDPESSVLTMDDLSNLRWREGKKAPEKMARGVAAACRNTAYLRPAGSRQVYVCTLSCGKLQWSYLPDCKFQNFSLAVINRQLLAIGGQSVEGDFSPTNSVYSMSLSGKKKNWEEYFPPMSVSRSNTAAVSTAQMVVVAGGYDRGRELDSVEVLNVTAKQWSTVASLPRRLCNLVGAVCGQRLYFAGGFEGQPSKTVLACSLSHVLPFDTNDSDELNLPTVSTKNGDESEVVWHQVADLPVTNSTVASLGGHLVSVGGLDRTDTVTSRVYRLDPEQNSWSELCVVKNKRERCFVAVFVGGKMGVMGGVTRSGSKTDGVEIADVGNNSS